MWRNGVVGFVSFFLLLTTQTVAQPAQHAFRIVFTDKQGSPPETSPLDFLSQRAIDRRTAQGIAVDSTDRPVSPVHMASVLSLPGAKFHCTSKWMNSCVILLYDSTQILSLVGQPYIVSIKRVGYFSSGLHAIVGPGNHGANNEPMPAKPNLYRTTGEPAYYGSAFTQTRLVNGDYLHDRGYKGAGKLIAVMDEGFTGVDTNPGFDSIRNNGRLVDRFNFVLNSDNVFTSQYHGTSALSTMAANMPGTYVGSAPDASYAIYITEGGPGDMEIELDNMVAATERADSIGADIITESLGYNTFSFPFTNNSLTYPDIDGKTTIVSRAANMVTSKGMLFLASAGNEGGAGWNYVLTPGDADSALTVGSVDQNKNIAGNSGYGPNYAGRIKPDVCMLGNTAWVLATGVNPLPIAGTSFAVSQLAGWAACLWQATSQGNPYRMRNAITNSGHLAASPNNHGGYGVPDFQKAHELLSIKDAQVTPTPDNWINVAPNPFTSSFSAKIYHTKTGEITTRITDISGREVHRSSFHRIAGVQLLPLNTESLQPGMYFLSITSAGKSAVVSIIKR